MDGRLRRLMPIAVLISCGALCGALMTSGAAAPEAQQVKRRISLDLYGVELDECLAFVSETAGVDILVEPGLNGVVSVHVEDQPWDKVLGKIARENDLAMIQTPGFTIIRSQKSRFLKHPDRQAPTLSYQGEPVYRYLKGGILGEPQRVQGSEPHYPEAARRARVKGVVDLEVTITRQGLVRDVAVKRGLPLGLTESAVEAVKEWRYAPILLDGEPVNVRYDVAFRFSLR